MRYPKPREMKKEKEHTLQARVVKEAGRYYVVSEGKVYCKVCGNGEFRVVVSSKGIAHLFCTRCGEEHVVDEPTSWRDFYCVGWEE